MSLIRENVYSEPGVMEELASQSEKEALQKTRLQLVDMMSRARHRQQLFNAIFVVLLTLFAVIAIIALCVTVSRRETPPVSANQHTSVFLSQVRDDRPLRPDEPRKPVDVSKELMIGAEIESWADGLRTNMSRLVNSSHETIRRQVERLEKQVEELSLELKQTRSKDATNTASGRLTVSGTTCITVVLGYFYSMISLTRIVL